MPVLRSRAHEALVAVLVMARESSGLTQREVIPRLPPWLSWEQSTLAKVETGRRIVAFEEVKALCEVYSTNLATIELQADAYEAALSHPVRSKPVASKRKKSQR